MFFRSLLTASLPSLLFDSVGAGQVIYKTKHIQVQHVYDCAAGFSNWRLSCKQRGKCKGDSSCCALAWGFCRHSGWSSDKKSWCCAHEQRGCPGEMCRTSLPVSLWQAATPATSPRPWLLVSALTRAPPTTTTTMAAATMAARRGTLRLTSSKATCFMMPMLHVHVELTVTSRAC